jgi:hypothetical protein
MQNHDAMRIRQVDTAVKANADKYKMVRFFGTYPVAVLGARTTSSPGVQSAGNSSARLSKSANAWRFVRFLMQQHRGRRGAHVPGVIVHMQAPGADHSDETLQRLLTDFAYVMYFPKVRRTCLLPSVQLASCAMCRRLQDAKYVSLFPSGPAEDTDRTRASETYRAIADAIADGRLPPVRSPACAAVWQGFSLPARNQADPSQPVLSSAIDLAARIVPHKSVLDRAVGASQGAAAAEPSRKQPKPQQPTELGAAAAHTARSEQAASKRSRDAPKEDKRAAEPQPVRARLDTAPPATPSTIPAKQPAKVKAVVRDEAAAHDGYGHAKPANRKERRQMAADAAVPAVAPQADGSVELAADDFFVVATDPSPELLNQASTGGQLKLKSKSKSHGKTDPRENKPSESSSAKRARR